MTASRPDRSTELDELPADSPTEEVPEGDIAEQAHPIDDEPRTDPTVGLEVDEADAVEQSHVVPDPDDDYRH